MFIETGGLEDDADVLAEAVSMLRQIESEECDFAGRGGDEGAEDSEEGGFAAAVGAEEAEDFAAADLERQIGKRGTGTGAAPGIIVAEAIDADDVVGGGFVHGNCKIRWTLVVLPSVTVTDCCCWGRTSCQAVSV